MDVSNQRINSIHESEGTNRGLTVFGLKVMALVTMFIDHVGAIIIPCIQSHVTSPQLFAMLEGLMTVMRLIGRISFPIFAFLIVNGFYHTRNRKKYVLRLGIFALISEPFFDLASSSSWMNFSHQNVFFTLCLGLVTIWGYDSLIKQQKSPVIGGLLVLFTSIVAFCLGTDYDAYGILMIFIMYLFFFNRQKMCLMVILLKGLIYGPYLFSSFIDQAFVEAYYGLTLTGGWKVYLQIMLYLQSIAQLFCVVALWPISKYRGEKGSDRINKYFFYAFYPVHLFILGMVSWIIG